jgi:beta-galactosidase
MSVPSFTLAETAPLFANLPAAQTDRTPRTMEAHDQGHGAILYRVTLPAGPSAVLEAADVHDFGFVFLDGRRIGVMDRRTHSNRVVLPERSAPAQLDLLVYALGRVNFGPEVHDRKGAFAPITLTPKGAAAQTLENWSVYSLPLDTDLPRLRWQKSAPSAGQPAFWRGSFTVTTPQDTYLDVSRWGFGIVWINGHCLGRFWNIGPTQTAFVPGPWLKAGANEVIVFDLTGPTEPTLAGLDRPVLNELHPERDFAPAPESKEQLKLDPAALVHKGAFAAGSEPQEVHFKPTEARQLCFEATNAHDGKAIAAVAELELLDAAGQPLSHAKWTIAYADSEEKAFEDGSAGNAIDGQTANAWITAWSKGAAPFPHRLVIDLGEKTRVGGLRYTPRSGADASGRIKDFRIYAGDSLVSRAQ